MDAELVEYEAGSRIPILEGRSEGPTGPSGKAQTLVQGGGGALMFGGHATSEIMPYIISEVPSALVMPTPCGSGPRCIVLPQRHGRGCCKASPVLLLSRWIQRNR
jgi:hypothetical protein